MFHYINQVRTFIAVVDCGSFTKAAKRLFIIKSMVSIHVKTLEDILNVPLLTRNTRGISLTDAGAVLYNDFSRIFTQIEASVENIANSHRALSGTLNLTSTIEFGEHYLLPIVGQFCQLHPQLNINFYADSSLNDLVTDRLDLAIRLGVLRNSALKCRKLASYNLVLVASKAWLDQNPLVAVEDLNHAAWIGSSNLSTPAQWTLIYEQDKPFNTNGIARFHANSASLIKAMAKAGLGVAILPEWLVCDDIIKGELIHLFPDYRLPLQDINILYAGDKRLRLTTRLFIDYLVENLRI